MIKKVIIFNLFIVLTLLSIIYKPVIIDAETSNEMNIVVDSKQCLVGKEVKVNVSLKDNPGITSLKLLVTYDESLLTLENVEYNSAMGGQTMMPGKLSSPFNLTWLNPLENNEYNGVFATLTFKVKEEAIKGYIGNITITYDPDDIYNIDEENINCNITNGQITAITCVPGDINNDGSVNNKDFTRFFQYIAGWNVIVNEEALDTNGDGKVNNKDVTRLFQYIAGWPVEIFAGQTLHAHSMNKTEAINATCTENGNIEYYYCTLCKKYYSDKEGNYEISLEEIELEAVGHTYSEEWTSDEESHWHVATCEHDEVIKDKENHIFGNDKVCNICSFDCSYLYKLDAPQNVKVAYDKITWDEVPNAKSYTVVVDGDYEFITNNNQCFLTEVKNTNGKMLFEDRTSLNKHGEISIVVSANDNGEYTKSDESNPVSYYYVISAGETFVEKQQLSDDYGLGLGYNMIETGFYTGMQPGVAVFDTSKLLAIDTLTDPSGNGGGGSYAYYYTSADDYLEQRTSSSGITADIGVSDNVFFTAGLKANLTYGGSEKYTSHRYFASYINRTEQISGIVRFGGQNSDLRIHCLSQEFLKDIRRENNNTKLLNDEELCSYLYNKYGTHVALGVVKGGYFESSYTVWTNSEQDLITTTMAFSAELSANAGTFFDVKLDVNSQGSHTIQTTHESTTSLLKTTFYGGSISGTSSDKASYSEWQLGSDSSVLSFTEQGAISIGSLITLFEMEYGNLGLNGSTFGTIYEKYVNERANDLYHDLYDKYTYNPPFNVEVVEEENKNVLVIDLSKYQATGDLNIAGCSYFVDGIFTVYPNMLGSQIDSIRLVGGMDKVNTSKKLLDGFSLALKGKWTNDVDIILENFGVITKSDYGIVDSTAISKSATVNIRYEGLNIVKETNDIYYCHINNGEEFGSFILSENDVPEWIFDNASIEEEVINLPVAKKENYDFVGWFDIEGNMIADSEGRLDITKLSEEETLTLEVQWNPETYTITLNNMGAETTGTDKIYLMYGIGYSESNPTDKNFDKLNTITIPTKKGYIFGGYYTNADVEKVEVLGENQYIDIDGKLNYIIGESVSINLAFKGDVILYAKWIPEVYTITLNNVDANNFGTTVFYVKYNEGIYSDVECIKPIEKIDLPSKDGFIFGGYYESIDGNGSEKPIATSQWITAEGIINTEITKNLDNMELVSLWTYVYTIVLDGQQADWQGSSNIYGKYESGLYPTVTCDSNYIEKIDIPTRKGYIFKGYYEKVVKNGTVEATGENKIIDENGQILINSTKYSTNTVIYALWSPIKYTISYNSNGGIGEMESSNHIYDVPQTLFKCTFERTGYILLGWNTDKNATTAMFKDGEEVKNVTLQSEVELYAIWAKNTFKIIYQNLANYNDPTWGVATYLYGEKTGGYAAPKLDKHTFLGWNYLETGFKEGDTMPAKDIVAIAQWIKTSEEVDFSVASGNRNRDVTHDDGVYETIYPNLDRNALKTNGYTYIEVTITFDVKEKNDGYQDIWVYSHEDLLLKHCEFESDDDDWDRHSWTFTINLNNVQTDGSFWVEYGAHGDWGDDWTLGWTHFSIVAKK